MSRYLLAVIQEFGIEDKLGYFVMDNASNNDTLLLYLSESIPAINCEVQRLRCLGHVINLVAKAILLGVDIQDEQPQSQPTKKKTRSQASTQPTPDISNETTLEDRIAAFELLVSQPNEEVKAQAWRKKGAVGKAHNIVVHINWTPQRVQLFEKAQREADGEAVKLYKLIPNGGIRWNSTEVMISRLIKLRSAVDLYCMKQQLQNNNKVLVDALTPEDWQDLIDLRDLLQPLKIMTETLEGNATTGSHGALW